MTAIQEKMQALISKKKNWNGLLMPDFHGK